MNRPPPLPTSSARFAPGSVAYVRFQPGVPCYSRRCLETRDRVLINPGDKVSVVGVVAPAHWAAGVPAYRVETGNGVVEMEDTLLSATEPLMTAAPGGR